MVSPAPAEPGQAGAGRPEVRLTAWVEGRVQGVGFRWWVRSSALELGLTGFAENLADGRVKVIAEGAGARCAQLLARLGGEDQDRGDGAGISLGPPGRVSRVTHRWGEATGGYPGFRER